MPSAVLPEALGGTSAAREVNLAVTVIMPVRNEGPHMRDSLEGVLRQDTAPDAFEVLGEGHDAVVEFAALVGDLGGVLGGLLLPPAIRGGDRKSVV